MKRIWIVLAMVMVVCSASLASAATFTMFESFTNKDGVLTWGADPLAIPVSTSYDFTTAQTWSTTFNTVGSHNFGVFVDPEITETVNTFFNETGNAVVDAAYADSRLSWAIGDPLGSIWYDVQNNNALGNGYVGPATGDVSLALMWNFNLNPNETASLFFSLSDTKPLSGFYLEQTESLASLYFSSTLVITDNGNGGTPVPEPSTIVLLGTALAGLGMYARKRKNV
jgi:hypothetical protein